MPCCISFPLSTGGSFTCCLAKLAPISKLFHLIGFVVVIHLSRSNLLQNLLFLVTECRYQVLGKIHSSKHIELSPFFHVSKKLSLTGPFNILIFVKIFICCLFIHVFLLRRQFELFS
ncbi:hypothetical protein POPTR_008G057232v4 [Populus trichocarpa]|uniref:Uncharacterized protein n=1 Tax=Populus trichocarpa TaxID=3694 RepID=A0ACC0SJX8_POPTR|nr:hypothetical protein POPTR_008G057232v4 [Populus trichocarpa]